jgi:hypothetical protein
LSLVSGEHHGTIHTAGDEVQGLEQIQTGDLISVEYTESPAMRMIRE